MQHLRLTEYSFGQHQDISNIVWFPQRKSDMVLKAMWLLLTKFFSYLQIKLWLNIINKIVGTHMVIRSISAQYGPASTDGAV